GPAAGGNSRRRRRQLRPDGRKPGGQWNVGDVLRRREGSASEDQPGAGRRPGWGQTGRGRRRRLVSIARPGRGGSAGLPSDGGRLHYGGGKLRPVSPG